MTAGYESRGPDLVGAAAPERGEVLTAISDGIVGVFTSYYGHGPSQAKTYWQDDLVVCVLRGGYTRVEETLRGAGRGDVVIEQRVAFQETCRDEFVRVIETATRRRVVGFMSGNHQAPDLMCEVFVLANSQPQPDGYAHAPRHDSPPIEPRRSRRV